MKRSAMVPATFLVAFAASLVSTGCQGRRCEDAMGRVLSDDECRRKTPGARFVPTGGFGSSSGGSSTFGG